MSVWFEMIRTCLLPSRPWAYLHVPLPQQFLHGDYKFCQMKVALIQIQFNTVCSEFKTEVIETLVAKGYTAYMGVSLDSFKEVDQT